MHRKITCFYGYDKASAWESRGFIHFSGMFCNTLCGIVITPSFLKIMNLQFFGGGIDNVEIHVTGPNDDDA
jgi:hypothetical protein